MNEIYTGKSKTATLPPIQIQAPSMTSVLDMLNIINGILFVQISPRDIENFKVEFEKRQQNSSTEVVEGGDQDRPESSSDNSSIEALKAGGEGSTSPPPREVTPCPQACCPLKEATPPETTTSEPTAEASS